MERRMGSSLRVPLLPGWTEAGTDAGAPRRFVRDAGDAGGSLQVSVALHRGGPEPRPTTARLQEIAQQFGSSQGFGQLADSSAGDCPFGSFGTAGFRGGRVATAQA